MTEVMNEVDFSGWLEDQMSEARKNYPNHSDDEWKRMEAMFEILQVFFVFLSLICLCVCCDEWRGGRTSMLGRMVF